MSHTKRVRFSHGRVLFDSRNVQKCVTQIIYLGPLPSRQSRLRGACRACCCGRALLCRAAAVLLGSALRQVTRVELDFRHDIICESPPASASSVSPCWSCTMHSYTVTGCPSWYNPLVSLWPGFGAVAVPVLFFIWDSSSESAVQVGPAEHRP